MLGRLLSVSCLALAFAAAALAQSDGSASASANSTSPASTTTNSPASTPKKIWTNEELPRGQGGVSVVGNKHGNTGSTTKQTADAAAIRTNIEKLQAQLDDVNKKLKTYKEFLDGEPVSTNAREWNKGVNRTPVDQQMAQLQDKKKKLEAQISDLYDEARKRGIDSNQLP